MQGVRVRAGWDVSVIPIHRVDEILGRHECTPDVDLRIYRSKVGRWTHEYPMCAKGGDRRSAVGLIRDYDGQFLASNLRGLHHADRRFHGQRASSHRGAPLSLPILAVTDHLTRAAFRVKVIGRDRHEAHALIETLCREALRRFDRADPPFAAAVKLEVEAQ